MDGFQLKEEVGEYLVHFDSKNVQLTQENSIFWNEFSESSTA
jgi:hypothetical protein